MAKRRRAQTRVPATTAEHDGADEALFEAQELMYEAFEARGPRCVALALQALVISPNCADAYVLLADETASSNEEARALLEEGVAAGERALGPQPFEEDVGYFWGILETRPSCGREPRSRRRSGHSIVARRRSSITVSSCV
jgi:hypothetical protein